MEVDRFRSYLSSTIPLKSTLLTSIESAKRHMSSYPSSRLLPGRYPKYLIKQGDGPFYMVVLKEDEVLFTTYSDTSPLYFLRDTLLRLLSVMAMLSEDYSIKANGLFPYFIKSLSGQSPQKPLQRCSHDRVPEFMLSKRIVCLLNENKALRLQANTLQQDLMRITSELILSKYSYNSSAAKIAMETKLDASYVSKVLESLRQNGNRIMPSKGGNFNIVGI